MDPIEAQRYQAWWDSKIPKSGDPDFVAGAATQIPSHLTSHPEAHAIQRHGGSVTDQQLMTRARTGVAPDGSVKRDVNGNVIVPPKASAFNSDALLVQADNFLRAGKLQEAIRANPTETYHVVTDNIGIILGRGYQRIGRARVVDPYGPLQRFDELKSATGVYELNPATGIWETKTIYPE